MAFDPLETPRTFARYNAWMNKKFLVSCSTLPDAARKRPLGVPFSSLHGVWNHLLVADNLWLSRFEQTPLPFQFRGLDMELFSDWDELKTARTELDGRIFAFAANLTEERLSSDLRWQPATRPDVQTTPFSLVLAHFWNHQTHHRGQISACMELLGLDCGITDLLAMPAPGA